MSVELTGTPSYVVNNDHGNSSETITIPADCDAVMVISGSWNNSNSNDFGSLNFDNGSSVDFSLIVNRDGVGDEYNVWSYIMTAGSVDWPGIGSNTLYWTFDQTPNEGGSVIVVFLKNVNASSPVVDTDGGSSTSFTSSLSGVASGDMTFGFILNFNVDGADTEAGTGQVELVSDSGDNSTEWSLGYELGESSFQISCTYADYVGIIAWSIAEDLGGGGFEPAWAGGSNQVIA
ncbi:MAG: hypothetical protein R3D55_11865 [Chloroflexota bacterium]